VKIRGIIATPIIHLSQMRISKRESKDIRLQEASCWELACGVGAIVPGVVPEFVGFVFGDPFPPPVGAPF